jgi:glycosyltransferase involved in cell wall biosynthesis
VPPGTGTPIIVTTHGLHALRAARRGTRGLFARGVTALALARARRIVCVSDDDAREVARLGLGRRSVIIPNGVAPRPPVGDLARRRARARLGLAPEAPVVLVVGSLIHQKHPELAVEAARLARRRLPGLTLLVAGEGPARLAVERLAGPWARLLGTRDDVDDLMAAADVVLNTSRWEGLSLALLEALWHGRPIVATDVPGNAQAVGPAGLVTSASAAALADALVRLLSDRAMLARAAAAARARAEERFDVADMVEATLALHSQVAR